MNLDASKPTTYYLVFVGCLVLLLLLIATSSGKPEASSIDIESAGLSPSAIQVDQDKTSAPPRIPSWASKKIRSSKIADSIAPTDHQSAQTGQVTIPEFALDLRLGDRSRGWKHLSTGVREAIDAVALQPHAWNAVVVHGGGPGLSDQNDIDHYHRGVLQLPGGMAYHFVLGNGSGSSKGEIEVGRRWQNQQEGPVGAAGEILICLIGDFDTRSPSSEQIVALDELLAYLRGKLGDIPLHCHEAGAGAGCLGAGFPSEWVVNALN